MDVTLAQGPSHMASRLATYIKDPSTIRAHVLNEYGRCPSLDYIKAEIAKHNRPLRQDVGEPTDADGVNYTPQGFERQKKEKKREWVPPPPTIMPWPKWFKPHGTRMPVSMIIKGVAFDFCVTPEQLISTTRSSSLVAARSVIARILRDRGHSFPVVGRLLGGRDHSTIMNSIRMFDIYAERDPRVKEAYRRYCDGSLMLDEQRAA